MLRTLLAAAILFSATACASLSEAQLEAREYRNEHYRNLFLDYRRACQARGGRVVVDARQKLGLRELPRYGDRYTCV